MGSIRNIFLLSMVLSFLSTLSGQNISPGMWNSRAKAEMEMEAVRKQIKAPGFKNKDYDVTQYGALGNGASMNTEAFKAAIKACHKGGGGRVVVPAGIYMTGPIYLKSNVNLYIDESAVIMFSQDPKDYPLVMSRWEGMDCINYSAQIYAYKEKNIAVTGGGTIDGNANNSAWWPWKGKEEFGYRKGDPHQAKARDALHEMMHQRVDPKQRVFGDGHYLRPSMFQSYECENVLISGVRLMNSPMWFIAPVLCENVIIEKVHIEAHGPNTDGCDPDACKNVLIKDCYFNTGDDCIAIKSGRDEDGRDRKQAAENHIIEGCKMEDGHGGVVIGSEIAGGARNIFIQNCNMSSPDLWMILRIKTSSSRGGVIENIFMKDIEVGQYRDAAIHCTMFYEKPGEFIPAVRNIWVENLKVSKGGKFGVFANTYPESPLKNLKMVNCQIDGVDTPFSMDHFKNLELSNVVVNGKLMDQNEVGKK